MNVKWFIRNIDHMYRSVLDVVDSNLVCLNSTMAMVWKYYKVLSKHFDSHFDMFIRLTTNIRQLSKHAPLSDEVILYDDTFKFL